MKTRHAAVLSILLSWSLSSGALAVERPVEPNIVNPAPETDAPLSSFPLDQNPAALELSAPVQEPSLQAETRRFSDLPDAPTPAQISLSAVKAAAASKARLSFWSKTIFKTQKGVSLEVKKITDHSSGFSAFSVGRKIWNIVSGRQAQESASDLISLSKENASNPLPRLSRFSPKQIQNPETREIPAPVEAEKILEELRERPPSAVFFDYDKTLTEVNEKGISLPPAKNLIEGIKTLLKRGWPIAIITSRTFDRQPASANFANTIEPLISQIPESLRDHLFFVGGAGSEFIAFKNGKPVRYLDRDWSEDEKEKISSIIDEALSELKISPEEVNISRDLPSQMLVRFNHHGDPRSTPFAELLDKNLKNRGLLFPVIHGGDFVYFNKFDKGMGAALIYSAMREKGFPVSEKNLLLVGDEFHFFPNGTMGGDAKMALAFPKSLSISVGKDLSGTLPPSVLWLGGRTSGTNMVMQELLRLPAPKKEDAFRRKVQYWTASSFLLGGLSMAALSEVPWTNLLHHPVSALGVAGSTVLSAAGIPQIVKNFKWKSLATKDLSLKAGLIWAAASALFLGLSLIKHSSPFWVASNLSGLLESSVFISQILLYNHKGVRGALSALSVALVSLAAVLGGISFPSVLFGAALGLLTVLNVPQIAANFKLYRAERKSPEGLSPLLSVLVIAGSALSLVVAATQGNIYWILTNAVSILMSALVLGQIYAPGPVNSILSKALFLRQ